MSEFAMPLRVMQEQATRIADLERQLAEAERLRDALERIRKTAPDHIAGGIARAALSADKDTAP